MTGSAMKRVAVYFGGALLLAMVFLAFRSFTPPIFSENSISRLERVSINDDQQYLLVRGHDRDLPVLLFLHGGPGMPAMYLAHDFQRELEKHFVVVHWDQRGAGKSYRKDTDPKTLTISQLLSDTDVVVDYLLGELDTPGVWLVGHSHGSYLGALYAQRHPEKLMAFVGLGQVADPQRATLVQDDFLRGQLQDLGMPADTRISGANRENLLFLTGSELYGETSFLPLVLTGLLANEYNLVDVLNVKKGSSFSSRNMAYDSDRNLIASATEFDVPVALVMGVHDMTTPVSLAREYYEAITAPDKRFILVKEASHFPHFEQPGQFLSLMLDLKAAWN